MSRSMRALSSPVCSTESACQRRSVVRLATAGIIVSFFLSAAAQERGAVGTLALPPGPTVSDLFQCHAFEEPLVPIGGDPSQQENAALGEALKAYAWRTNPDEFSSLTAFLERYPKSAWAPAL